VHTNFERKVVDAFVYHNTTRNYLICDAFSSTFSENVTNVHCSPKHYDDFFNSSRFYNVFIFSSRMCIEAKTLRRFVKFVAILRRIPFFVTNTATICLDCRDSTTYSYFSSRTCIDGY
jgi:hypothetical protein